ncbi:MAG: glutaredoxin [Alphaproteobacteria bacterium]|nr:glutaredoxin [Alphaproteobacteria bacterium]MDE2496065.1 glutaredoxin [Alphaproteobacteria bacterium]
MGRSAKVKTLKRRQRSIRLTLYKWAGSWGPFKIRVPCGECALTEDVIMDTLATELEGIPVDFRVLPWLDNWYKPIWRGAWHAPIVIIEHEVVSQGDALNRGVLAERMVSEYILRYPVSGTHLFGKDNCKHCNRAKQYLKEAGIEYAYHNVVKNPARMYEMLARVKPIIGKRTPITVPQIWIDGVYIGGADQLSERLHRPVEANTDRGHSSLSPGGGG